MRKKRSRSRSRSRSSGQKKGPKGKKSADADFDECSLEAWFGNIYQWTGVSENPCHWLCSKSRLFSRCVQNTPSDWFECIFDHILELLVHVHLFLFAALCTFLRLLADDIWKRQNKLCRICNPFKAEQMKSFENGTVSAVLRRYLVKILTKV